MKFNIIKNQKSFTIEQLTPGQIVQGIGNYKCKEKFLVLYDENAYDNEKHISLLGLEGVEKFAVYNYTDTFDKDQEFKVLGMLNITK